MKRSYVILTLAALCAVLAVGPIAAQTVETVVQEGEQQVGAGQLVEVQGTVTAIDLEYYEVTIETDEGEEIDITAGPEARNLDQIEIGDDVLIQFYEGLTLKLDKVEGGMTSLSETNSEVRAEPGEKPGGIRVSEITIRAKVDAVDVENGTVTVTGPKGRTVTLDADPERIANITVGDIVEAVYTQALAVSVSKVEIE